MQKGKAEMKFLPLQCVLLSSFHFNVVDEIYNDMEPSRYFLHINMRLSYPEIFIIDTIYITLQISKSSVYDRIISRAIKEMTLGQEFL